MSDQLQETMNQLVTALAQYQHTNGAVPALYEGARNTLTLPQLPGPVARLVAWLLNPSASLQTHYTRKEIELYLETEFKGLETDAQEYLDKKELDRLSAIRMHEHLIALHEDVTRRDNEARAAIQKHRSLASRIQEVQDSPAFDADHEELLITELVAIFTRQKESSNGRK